MGDKRWMLFVDGENFAMRGQAVAADAGQPLTEGRFYVPDVFLWPPGLPARNALTVNLMWQPAHELQHAAVRSYYYTSTPGDPARITDLRALIHRVGFDPTVFRRTKTRASKGVDITLTVDMLTHAREDHFDVAVLLAGDADYIPLIEAVKRLGKLVWVGFFDAYAGREMKIVPDFYTSMEKWLLDPWSKADPKAIAAVE